MKNKTNILAVAILCLIICMGCEKGREWTTPSFLHIDSITLYEPSESSLGMSEGFYTSDIKAAYVSVHYPGQRSVDTIGLFELPFTVPILYQGVADYIHVYPAVAQSGVSGTLPYYPAFDMINIYDTTFRAEDTLNLGALRTTYTIDRSNVLLYIPFEEDEHLSIPMTGVEWVKNNAAEARTGSGYGRLYVASSQETVDFAIDSTFTVNDPSLNIYLELDIQSDVEVQLYMRSRENTNGAFYTKPVMVIRPSSEWGHLYINLGRTWRTFNLHPEFTLSFKALNAEGNSGYVNIDNLKLITFIS